MIVTIDGPAGAGKSSVAKALARRLGFRFLDTGAMYRAVALAAVQRGLDLTDSDGLVRLASAVQIEIGEDRILLDGQDVTDQIRTSAVTEVIHFAADNPGVREQLVQLQRRAAGGDNVVTEGRDQGTVVFPEAKCKIFLTASPEERAGRRLKDLAAQGEDVTLTDVLANQEQRDRRDSSRDVGPLQVADDAIEVPTDGLTLEEVVDWLESLVQEKSGECRVESGE